jgi:hypothetical protein
MPRYGLAAVEYGGNIYAIGGLNDEEGRVDLVERYEPLYDEWEELECLNTARSHCGVALIEANNDGIRKVQSSLF